MQYFRAALSKLHRIWAAITTPISFSPQLRDNAEIDEPVDHGSWEAHEVCQSAASPNSRAPGGRIARSAPRTAPREEPEPDAEDAAGAAAMPMLEAPPLVEATPEYRILAADARLSTRIVGRQRRKRRIGRTLFRTFDMARRRCARVVSAGMPHKI